MKKFSSLLVVLLLMLASFTAGMEYPRGDVDYNGKVNIADVVTLIDYLLTGTWDEPVTPPDMHEWVDLGLPSGTLWETCNVGANAPEEAGDYFAWGETEPKEVYTFETYKWCNGSMHTITKYCTHSGYGSNGFTDGKTELDPGDDAAYVNWGSSWRMPSKSQQDELRDNCTWTWTNQNGVEGRLVTGPNGNTMFLPTAGYRESNNLTDNGTGLFWSRTIEARTPSEALILRFNCEIWHWTIENRCYGLNVRAVRVSQN